MRWALLLAAAALSRPGHAQMFQGGWYVDAAAGQGNARGDNVSRFGDNGNVWAARFGARLSPNFAIDAGYEDLGKYDLAASNSFLGPTKKMSSWGVSLVAIAPFDALDVYGRLGYARTESKLHFFQLPDRSFDQTTHDNEAFYGVGARYNFGRVGVFAEWNKHDKVDIDYWLLGVQLRF